MCPKTSKFLPNNAKDNLNMIAFFYMPVLAYFLVGGGLEQKKKNPPTIVDTPPARAQETPTAVLVLCNRKSQPTQNDAWKKHYLFQKGKLNQNQYQ